MQNIDADLKRSRSRTATHKCMFIPKTFDMVSNPDFANTISWSPDGKEVLIKHVGQLCSQVLPHYFNHRSYQSFIRQLNKYGFEKVKGSKLAYDVYRNQFFQRDKREYLD